MPEWGSMRQHPWLLQVRIKILTSKDLLDQLFNVMTEWHEMDSVIVTGVTVPLGLLADTVKALTSLAHLHRA